MDETLTQKKPYNRYLVLVGAILSTFCIGLLYSWSVFQNPIIEKFGWEVDQVSLAFSLETGIFPLAMMVSGFLLPKLGPTKLGIIGGILISGGMFIASGATTLTQLYLGFGIIAGCGSGVIYGIPISTCAGWFPDKTGIITGLAITGSGLGSTVYAPIAGKLVAQYGPMHTMAITATIMIIGITIGACLMRRPPKATDIGVEDEFLKGHQYKPSEMLRTWQFYLLIAMFSVLCSVGLMVVGHASPMGQYIAGITPAQAAVIVSVWGISNTIGRFGGGALSDKFGAFKVVAGIFVLNVIMLLTLKFMTSFALYAVAVAVSASTFGAMVGSYPSIVLAYYGRERYSANYGIMFLAYGIGGIVGPQIAARTVQITGGEYTPAFIICAALCAVCIAGVFCCKKPVWKEE